LFIYTATAAAMVYIWTEVT